jgi:hypothetical protein
MRHDTVTDLPPPTRFLTVAGVLMPDGRLALQPGFVTDDPLLASQMPDSPLVAEFLDGDGGILLRVGVPIAPFLVDPADGTEATLVEGPDAGNLAVAGKLPYPEATRLIRFLLRDVPIHELPVSEQGPALEVGWDIPRDPAGVQRIAWSATHPEGREVSYVLAYTNDDGATWQPLLLPSPVTELEVDFDTLPGGRGRLRLIATDGTTTAMSDSPMLRVARKPCVPTIFEPADGAEFPGGEPITLHGQGYYLEERRVDEDHLDWTSSLDGPVGNGAAIQVELRSGKHKITLEAGTPARRASTSVNVTVRPGEPGVDQTAR